MGCRVARAVLVVILWALPVGSALGAVDPLARGRALFDKNELTRALPFFERAARERPGDAEPHCWLSEVHRRLGNRDMAEIAGRRALEIDPCSAFGHTVLGLNFSPQYGEWWGADDDSTWLHLLAATECDPNEGDAWQSLAIQAMARGERGIERTALLQLVRSGFLTPTALAVGRWLLATLPDSAVLIVNGDLDTYPPRALQEAEGFRRDVVIVNISLLELGWYRSMISIRHGVPSPFPLEELHDLEPVGGPAGTWIGPGRRMAGGWFAMVQAGTLRRPLAVSVTVPDLDFGHDSRRRLVLCGPFWLVMADTVTAAEDTSQIRNSLMDLRKEDFRGPDITPRERSPIIRTSAPMATNIMGAAERLYMAERGAGRDSSAAALRSWALEFVRAAELDPFIEMRIREWPEAYGVARDGTPR